MAIKDVELITRRVIALPNDMFEARAEARNEHEELLRFYDVAPMRSKADVIAAMDGWIRVYTAGKRNAYVSTHLDKRDETLAPRSRPPSDRAGGTS